MCKDFESSCTELSSLPQVHSFAADLQEYVAEALGENVTTGAVTCIYRLADASRTNLQDVAQTCAAVRAARGHDAVYSESAEWPLGEGH